MLILALTVALGAQAFVAQDTAIEEGAVYDAVLHDLRGRPPVPAKLPIVLRTRMYNVRGSATQQLPERVLQRLKSGGSIEAVCRGEESQECQVPATAATFVSLGPVLDLLVDARVKIVPEKLPPGVSEQQALTMIPDSVAVRVDAAVDVVIHTPCPDAPTSPRCRVPDIELFRYFLRAEADSTYRVVTRWLVGGA